MTQDEAARVASALCGRCGGPLVDGGVCSECGNGVTLRDAPQRLEPSPWGCLVPPVGAIGALALWLATGPWTRGVAIALLVGAGALTVRAALRKRGWQVALSTLPRERAVVTVELVGPFRSVRGRRLFVGPEVELPSELAEAFARVRPRTAVLAVAKARQRKLGLPVSDEQAVIEALVALGFVARGYGRFRALEEER